MKTAMMIRQTPKVPEPRVWMNLKPQSSGLTILDIFCLVKAINCKSVRVGREIPFSANLTRWVGRSVGSMKLVILIWSQPHSKWMTSTGKVMLVSVMFLCWWNLALQPGETKTTWWPFDRCFSVVVTISTLDRNGKRGGEVDEEMMFFKLIHSFGDWCNLELAEVLGGGELLVVERPETGVVVAWVGEDI